MASEIQFQAKAETGEGRRVAGVAYAGGRLNVAGYPQGVIVDLATLNPQSGRVPLATDHSAEFQSQIGHAEFRVEGGRILFEGEIVPGTPAADRAIALRERGGFSVSVGIEPGRLETLPHGETREINGMQIEGPAEIAHNARLREISAVGVGADPEAAAIAARKADSTMTSSSNQYLKAELEREREIVSIFENLSLGGDSPKARELISAGASVDQAREVAIRMFRSKGSAVEGIIGIPRMRHGVDQRTVMAAWLAKKSGYAPDALYGERAAQAADDLRCHSTIEFLAQTLRMAGREVPSSRNQMIEAAVSTGSMPVALSDVANKVAERAYTDAPAGWRAFTQVRSAPDFKQIPGIRLGWGLGFDRVANAGELRHGQFVEETTEGRVETYGSKVAISRQDLINDDLRLVQEGVREFARAAARRVADEVAARFANPGQHFSLGRGNLIEGADSSLGIEGLTEAIAAMRAQRDLDGRLIDAVPRVLLVPAALETVALRIVRGEMLAETGDTDRAYGSGNPFLNRFEVLVDPRLDEQSERAWYLLGAPADAPMLAYFLEANEHPTIEIEPTNFSQLGLQMRGYLDFGISFGDYRMAIKSTGEAGDSEAG